MKLLIIILVITQVSGALSTASSLQDQRGLLDIWHAISPIAIPIALGVDNTLAAISNAHSSVTTAIAGAIHGVTSWIGGKLPALGKRDLQLDARFNLLAELKSFQTGFQQSIINIIKSFLNGNSFTTINVAVQLPQLLSKFNAFMQTHLNNMNHIITNLIPTMQDAAATQAITSCLHAVQVIEQAMQKIRALFSS